MERLVELYVTPKTKKKVIKEKKKLTYDQFLIHLMNDHKVRHR